MFYVLVILLTCSVSAFAFAFDVHLVTPDSENITFHWSSASTWNDSRPTQSSTVYVDGKGMKPILVIDFPPKVYSLHLYGVTLRFESLDVSVTDTTTCDDVLIEAVTGQIANFTTTNLEVLVPCELSLINFVIKGNGKLSNKLSLSLTSLLVDFGAELVIEGGSSDSFELKAWGNGRYGRTGTNHTVYSHTLLPVITDEEFTFIAGGLDHTLGITSEGSLFAWGLLGLISVGQNVYIYDPYNFPEPVDLDNVVQISAGGGFSLARTQDNFVYSWGRGTLGHGDEDDQPKPKHISTLENVVDISAGRGHSLAVLSNGKVKAWGGNFYGQLGDGSTTRRTTPVEVNTTDSIKKSYWLCTAFTLYYRK
ncbi:hypothetical protein P9112_013446 [Eukaryota sp. TZLM1-RC]